MIIYGAGMAGLLTATMLRRFLPIVRERQASLPDNHGALLRFRSEAVAQASGQSFRKVRVFKAVKADGHLTHRADLRLSNLYSLKVTGQARTRSILDTNPVDRWIAPDDFISAMSAGTSIQYGSRLSQFLLEQHREQGEPIISTIPMDALMSIVGWEDRPEFNYQGITSFRAVIESPEVEVYQTVYYPEHRDHQYRASITGNLLTVEYMGKLESEDLVRPYEILEDFGLARGDTVLRRLPLSFQQYGKLLPINEKMRRAFILAMTDQYRLYSVGRFATWRQILLDDVVKDVSMVASWVTERDAYSRHLHNFGAPR